MADDPTPDDVAIGRLRKLVQRERRRDVAGELLGLTSREVAEMLSGRVPIPAAIQERLERMVRDEPYSE